MVTSNETNPLPEGLKQDLEMLRRVATRHLLRAYHIPDDDVAGMVTAEAGIMLTVVSKVEQYLESR